jgi:hypothetical protein
MRPQKLFPPIFDVFFIGVLARFRKKSFWEDLFPFSYNMVSSFD